MCEKKFLKITIVVTDKVQIATLMP